MMVSISSIFKLTRPGTIRVHSWYLLVECSPDLVERFLCENNKHNSWIAFHFSILAGLVQLSQFARSGIAEWKNWAAKIHKQGYSGGTRRAGQMKITLLIFWKTM